MKRDVTPEIIEAIKEMVWMARRYASGRKTYTPWCFNNAYVTLCNFFGQSRIDISSDFDVETFPFAKDGDFEFDFEELDKQIKHKRF